MNEHDRDELNDLQRRVEALEATVTANRDAARKVRALLELPDARPGAWEAEHVVALDGELRGVLDALEASA